MIPKSVYQQLQVQYSSIHTAWKFIQKCSFICLVWPREKLSKDEQRNLDEDLFSYTKKNMLMINVFMKDMSVALIETDEKVPTISFIANIGGLLGLCIGLSAVSIFELIYHFVLALKHRLTKNSSRPQSRRKSSSF